jgi:PAS domain S-box-containing protein
MLFLTVFVIAGILSGGFAKPKGAFDISAISSYRDIPGVTAQEIDAVEALKSSRRNFSYGGVKSVELFTLPNGANAGFTAGFCRLLSDLFSIPFETSFYEWDVLPNRVGSGLTDFTGELLPTDERHSVYKMTAPIAQRSLTVFTNSNKPIQMRSELDLEGFKAGFLKNTIIHSFVMNAYPSLRFEKVDARNNSEAVEMLHSGAIDAFITESVDKMYFLDRPSIRAWDVLPLVFIPVSLTTANPELEPVISVVNKYISAGGFSKLHDLYIEGNSEYAKYTVSQSLSDTERAYIAGLNAKVPVVLESDNYPASFYNKQEREFQGIAIDILAQISRLTDIQFETVNEKYAPWANILETLENGGASLITTLSITEKRKGRFLWHETPYLLSPHVFISKTDYPDLELYQIGQATVATIKGTSYEELYNTWFPGSTNIKLYNFQSEAFDALENGEADLVLASEYSIQYQMNFRERPGYKINYAFQVYKGSYFGFNINESVLCSIIDKTLRHIDTDKISKDWTGRVYDYSKKIEHQRLVHLSVFAAALLLILALIIILTINIIQKKKIIAGQSLSLKAAYELAEAERLDTEYDIQKYKLTSDALNIALWDMQVMSSDPVNPNNKFTWSREFRTMLGFTDENDFPNVLSSWSDRLHPEDKEFALKAFEAHMSDRTGDTPYDIEYRLMLKNGDYRIFHAFGTTLRDNSGKPLRVAGAVQDITEKKQTEEALRLRTVELKRTHKLLFSINRAAAALLTAQDDRSFEDTILSSMEKICHIMDIDCIEIWRNETINGELHAVLINNWYSEAGRQAKSPSVSSFPYSDTPGWDIRLSKGELIKGPVSKLSEADRNFLAPFNVKSILSIPIIINNRFWGMCCIDDCRHELMLTEEEIEILRSGALMLINAIIRNAQAAQISAARERAMLMLDTSPLCSQIWDKNLNIIDCNEAAVKLYGLRDKQEYLERFFELSPQHQPDGQLSNDKAVIYINKAFNEGNCTFEWMQQIPNGSGFSPMPVEVTLVRVKYGDDHVVMGYTRDLRKYKEMMRDIENSGKLLHAVNHAASVLLSNENIEDTLTKSMEFIGRSTDTDRVQIWRNEMRDGQLHFTHTHEWLSETGRQKEPVPIGLCIPYSAVPEWEERFSRGEYINQPLSEMPSDSAAFKILSKYEINTIVIIPLVLNDTFWGFFSIDDCKTMRIFTDDEINILRSVSLMMANAIIRSTQAADIREADERAALMLNSTPLCCQLWDVNFKKIDCNDEAIRLFGFKDKNDFLENFFKLYPEFQPCGQRSEEKAVMYVKKAFDEGRCAFEWTYKMLDGSIMPAEVVLVRIIHKGEFMVAGYTRDLREHNKMIEELESALDRANMASKAKGDFLSTMSHEMRTPMNAIIGMTTIAKKTEKLEDKNTALNKIGDASSHLLGVINDVLDMAKIEANKLELSPIEFDFDRMLQKVITVINFRVDEKEQSLIVNVDDEIPRFLIGDAQRLSQVITNLMSNAVKFTPESGRIDLEASLTEKSMREDGVCELRIAVTDSGIGISPEHQEKLFQAFEQAESGTNREYGGTGLGLAISKSIVELMGGRIWIESEFGKGAKFIFTVKLRCGEKNSRSLLAPGVNWENMRILVVDDIAETRDQFNDLFEQLDIKCDAAADGFEALKFIEKRGEYDIYFIDWRMPGMNGIELTKQIKSREGARQSVVIMITAMDWDQVKSEADKVGVDKHILKPLLSSTIIDCVNECLGKALDQSDTGSNTDGEFTGKRLLLVEDIEINREILISLLEDTGLLIDCAENGKEALDIISAHPYKYDVVFMDIQMPKMDGYEATRRIRALPNLLGAKLPIIALTANVFKNDIEACLKAGMDDHLGKPFDIDMVFEKLRGYLGREREIEESVNQ